MRRRIVVGLIIAVVAAIALTGLTVLAQDAAKTAAALPAGAASDASVAVKTDDIKGSFGFWSVVTGSGWLGILIWVGLFGDLFAAIWIAVDCGITVRASKIMPQTLVDKVTESMAQGDVLKALSNCEDDPGPMANILTAGFSHVEEGFEVIQEAVGLAADFESEKLMQRISYLSVCAAIAPMLGLLGTVQGMILAFAQLAAMGVAVISMLAAAIGQALYTTFAGLTIAIPTVACFAFFRNKANKIILRMETITMELIKDLRNVEVVQE